MFVTLVFVTLLATRTMFIPTGTDWILWSRDECHARQMQNFHSCDFTEMYPLLHFVFSKESTSTTQFQSEISQSNVKYDTFYKRLKLIFCTQTIIVKSIGKVAFLTSFFLPIPVPDPMLSKTYVCAPNCSVISQH